MSSTDSLPDGIAILDFGGQYCHLIARRVREMNVYSEILPSDATRSDIEALDSMMMVKGIIFSGSPSSVKAQDSLKLDPEILEIGVPVLGLCYGLQLLANMHGGRLEKAREYGVTKAYIDESKGILEGMEVCEQVWMSHGDTVFEAPDGWKVVAHTDRAPVAAMVQPEKQIWGLQWHPEVNHTEHGMEMLRNFVFNVSKAEPNWRPLDTVEEAIEKIKQIVGDGKAIIALSGGVDSSVAAALAASALGKRLMAVHVDQGLMRMNESAQVAEAFKDRGLQLVVVEARKRFIEKLEGVIEPETKRKIIGEEFIRVFEEKAKEFGAEFLIQGTIYPDRIESGLTKNSDTIKTHHNVGGLPSIMDFKQVIDPLEDLYKDEVRGLGERLGLPRELVWRQPFPGPGLAVRIVGTIDEDKLDVLRQADTIVVEEIEGHPFSEKLWQYFAVLTDTKSTGVKGDERAYGYTIAVRIVESIDAMTANFSKAPWEVLERISNRIGNEIPSVTRIVYDITHKPPSTIEWE
ncbi:MAG: glutamine-hydrolyzing GMP synthase [Candidatus Bathyarchaeota archaeon]|nr:glutamine-hydrolyzing GMP synthase [Candidatus Bathyarchaeota archaeon]